MRGLLQLLRESVVGALTQNLGLKAFALLATLLIFSLVRGTEEAQTSMKVDVVALLPPPTSGRVLVTEVPENVRVTVRGSASIVEALRRDGIPPVQVDLRGPPLRRFYFDEGMFLVPAGVRVVSVSESDESFGVEWERLVTRRISVRVETIGHPAPGTTVGQVTTSPTEISVSGAESRVMALAEVETEPINVSGRGLGKLERQVALRRPPPHTDYETEQPIRASVEIVPDVVERLYSGVQVTVLGGVHRMEVRPARIDVRLRGPREVMSSLAPDRILPFVDGAAITEGPGETARATPKVEDLPSAVEMVELIPAHVFIDVRRGRAPQ
ncbi:MAG: hypothetical protein HYY06_32435 [Deltaproteobacteria bacterium]|nr:hypothetical protein [Deltaproteobacteria bacterium]